MVRIATTFPWYSDPAYVDAVVRAYRGRSGRWVVESAIRSSRGGFAKRTDRLDREASRTVDAILADRCLYANPTRVGGRWPTVLRGPDVVVGCHHGSDTVVEVIHRDRRWATAQNCRTHGLVSQLVELLSRREITASP